MKIKNIKLDDFLNSIVIGGVFACVGFLMRSENNIIVTFGFILLWLLFSILIKIFYEGNSKVHHNKKKALKNFNK